VHTVAGSVGSTDVAAARADVVHGETDTASLNNTRISKQMEENEHADVWEQR